MTDEQIRQMMIAALKEVAPKRSAELDHIGLDAPLKELPIDSVSTMEMVGLLEEEMGVTFADDELARVHKLRDLADMMRAATSARAA